MDADEKISCAVHADESSQTGHRYIVIGSIVCDRRAVPCIDQALRQAKGALQGHELKWNKVKGHNLSVYRDFVECFFAFAEARRVQFHSIVIDSTKLKHQVFNQGDGDLGFNKFVYQLLLKYARLLPKGLFYVYLDRRTTRHDPAELRLILNAGAFKKYGIEPYRLVQFTDSEKSEIVQAVDVLIGAIAYEINGHHLKPNAAPAKKRLAEFVRGKTGLLGFACSTPPYKKGFSIWHFRLA